MDKRTVYVGVMVIGWLVSWCGTGCAAHFKIQPSKAAFNSERSMPVCKYKETKPSWQNFRKDAPGEPGYKKHQQKPQGPFVPTDVTGGRKETFEPQFGNQGRPPADMSHIPADVKSVVFIDFADPYLHTPDKTNVKESGKDISYIDQ